MFLFLFLVPDRLSSVNSPGSFQPLHSLPLNLACRRGGILEVQRFYFCSCSVSASFFNMANTLHAVKLFAQPQFFPTSKVSKVEMKHCTPSEMWRQQGFESVRCNV
jgi:hypothetical protein